MFKQLSWLLARFLMMGVLVLPRQYYFVDSSLASMSKAMLADDLDMRGRPNFCDLSPSFCLFLTTSVLLVLNFASFDVSFEC